MPAHRPGFGYLPARTRWEGSGGAGRLVAADANKLLTDGAATVSGGSLYVTTVEAAGSFSAGDGTVSVPGYRWMADPDTGFRRYGSGSVRFVADGADAVELKSGYVCVNSLLVNTILAGGLAGSGTGNTLTVYADYTTLTNHTPWNNTSGVKRLLYTVAQWTPASGNGVFRIIDLQPTINQTAGCTGSYCINHVDVTEISATGTDNAFCDWKVGSASKFKVSSAGSFTCAGDANIGGNLNHDGANVGFFGHAVAGQPGSYTLTYPTGAKTLPAYTPDAENSAYTGIANNVGGTPYAQLTDLNALRVAYENLRSSHDELLKVTRQLIFDLQSLGLVS
jgi:hypothetical protein